MPLKSDKQPHRIRGQTLFRTAKLTFSTRGALSAIIIGSAEGDDRLEVFLNAGNVAAAHADAELREGRTTAQAPEEYLL